MAFSFSLPTPKPCADCGGEGIFHRMTYASIVIDETMGKLLPSSTNNSAFSRMTRAVERLFGVWLLESLVLLGLAKKQLTPDDGTLLLAACLWEEGKARGITLYEWRLFGLPRNILVATYPNGSRIAFEGIPEAPHEYDRVQWIDDKAVLKEKFRTLAIPVAKGGAARTEKKALELFRSITPPAIGKPRSGSGSRHTILHITDEIELIRAFRIARQVSPSVVIEEELVGPVYRATVVDGKFVAALRRDPPSVVGDGMHTLSELVAAENQKSGRQGPYFSPIQLFDERGELASAAMEELAWQHLTLKDVPAKDRRVYFNQKVNWSVGGTTADVTDDVHPDNRALFERAAQALKAPITGIDFIIRDISRSWEEQDRCGILECNSMPFFDNHHLPFEGTPRNVAAALWDMVTPAGAMHRKS